MMFKAILFDLDGTLVDTVPVIQLCNREVCRAMDLPFDETRMRNWIGIPLASQAAKMASDRVEEYIETYRTVYRNYQDRSTALFPGTIQMLDALAGRSYLTGLVTSKNTAGTNRVLEASCLTEHFNVVITANDCENHKPHPEPILKALSILEIGPEEALYVGDSLYDLECAREAGVKAVGVSWGARSREDLVMMNPEAVFDNWSQFLEWLPGRR